MVDTLFHVINLMLLVAIGVYIFKRYIIPALSNEMDQELTTHTLLRHEREDLIGAQHETQRAIHEQDQLCKTLMLKVDQWHSVIAQQKNERAEQLAHTRHLAQQRTELQAHNYALYSAQKKVAPRLKKIITHELRGYYNNQEHAQSYITNIVHYIHK
jgi:hypothetical protein